MPALEVDARWDTAARLYQIWASDVYGDGHPSHVFAVREVPHVWGVLATVAGLVRRGEPYSALHLALAPCWQRS
jgi:hypothetical protein